MNDISRVMQSPVVLGSIITAPCYDRAHGGQDICERFMHMFRLLYLVISIVCMKPQHWNSKFVNNAGIYLAIAFFSCYCFTATCHTHMRPIEISIVLFQ